MRASAPIGVCQSADTSWRVLIAAATSDATARRCHGGAGQRDRLAGEPAGLPRVEWPHPGSEPSAAILAREGGERVQHELRARRRMP
jgi:hypothetical protein